MCAAALCVLCRAVLQLLTPSFMLSKTNGRDGISKGDLEEAASLFHDAKYSARMLAEQADKYIT
jgi:RuvB-like protein 1 (pontin 52)